MWKLTLTVAGYDNGNDDKRLLWYIFALSLLELNGHVSAYIFSDMSAIFQIETFYVNFKNVRNTFLGTVWYGSFINKWINITLQVIVPS